MSTNLKTNFLSNQNQSLWAQSFLVADKKCSTKMKKSLSAGLTLTSLVDCFTILVVYLLVATTIGGQEVPVSKGIQLPVAGNSQSSVPDQIIRFENGTYYVKDQAVPMQDLLEFLKANKGESESIIVMADKGSDFAAINPLVLSALQAGYAQVKFAAMQIEGAQ